MQHLEDDMDELFQRAAENYPLKMEKVTGKVLRKNLQLKMIPKKLLFL